MSAGVPAGSSRPTSAAKNPPRGELALGADVEQARAQPERDGESGEGERRRLVEHLSEARTRCPTCPRAAGGTPRRGTGRR